MTVVAKAEMLVRRPVAEVFEAVVDPVETTRFWFTKSTGRLEPGAKVQWTWEMYGVTSDVTVTEFEPQRRIVHEWGMGDGPATTVEWVFTDRPDGTTFVSVTESGFAGDGAAAHAVGSTEGFTMVLAALKALLEHGIILTVVADRFPDGLGDG